MGPPGTTSPLQRTINGIQYTPDFLFLVNGQDDNGNGWVDEGWDGVDNNGNSFTDELAEWETEVWKGAGAGRYAPASPLHDPAQARATSNAREVSLPTNVLIDLTTWNTTAERSRLPVNQFTGYVDIMVYPNGAVVPTTIYSSPSSVSLAGAFYEFWLAERSDITNPAGTTTPTLPLGLVIPPPPNTTPIPYSGTCSKANIGY